MKQYTYLAIDIACILVPFIASFYRRHSFAKEWKYFFPANILVGLFFIVWDQVFTSTGVWGFNPEYVSGIYLLDLPLEEVLFFISIPYACVFTWFAFKYLLDKDPLENYNRRITLVLILALLVGAALSVGRTYSFITFLFTGIFLLLLYYRKTDLSFVYISYLAILPFFFVSNGILTGSWLDDPIVWYNNNENLGVRLGTIPLEDSVYGFLLILMNISLYKYIKHRHTKA